MTPKANDDGAARDGLMVWVRENWDEPSGVGKAKLAAIAVLLLLFVALFGEDDGLPREEQAGSQPAASVAVIGQETPDTIAGAAPDLSAGDSASSGGREPGLAVRHPSGGSAAEDLPPHSYVTEPILPGAVDVPLITTTNSPLVPELLDAPATPPPAPLAADEAADLRAENARLQAALDASEARVKALEKALEQANAGSPSDNRDDLKAEVDALRQRLNELLDQLRDSLEARPAPETTPASALL